MTPPLRRGEMVEITAEARTLRAMITLASDNGRSIIAMYDGILGGFVGVLPAFEHDDGTWRALDGMPITIARMAR